MEFLECIKELIRVDREWVPKIDNCSLYLRPTFIGTEVPVSYDDPLPNHFEAHNLTHNLILA